MPTIDAFRNSITAATPPPGTSPALEALWWARRGDWTKAHECVQAQEGDRDCDRVHAHLHRQEGDMSNAGWWYRRVKQSMPTVSLQDEWNLLATELLTQS